jgi:hypothetical protein
MLVEMDGNRRAAKVAFWGCTATSLLVLLFSDVLDSDAPWTARTMIIGVSAWALSLAGLTLFAAFRLWR